MNEPPEGLKPIAATLTPTFGPSPLRKRSLILNGHATSLALEDAFWRALERWATDEGRSLSDLVAEIDTVRAGGSLASAVRVALLERAEARAAACEQAQS